MSTAPVLRPYTGLVKLGALASTVSGALRITSTLIPYEPESAPLEVLYGVIDFGLMFGLVALYLAHAERLGTAGLAAFAIALTGVASIVGPDADMFGLDFYRLGALTFVSGLALLSAVMLRAHVMRLVAALWLTTFAASLATSIWPPASMIAGVLLGSGYVFAGISMLRRPAPSVSPQPG